MKHLLTKQIAIAKLRGERDFSELLKSFESVRVKTSQPSQSSHRSDLQRSLQDLTAASSMPLSPEGKEELLNYLQSQEQES